MRELVEFVTRSLVDRPDEVRLTARQEDGCTALEVRVAPDDIGKLIGRDGRTIQAIRTVVAHACLAQGIKARLEVVGERRGGAARRVPGPVVDPT